MDRKARQKALDKALSQTDRLKYIDIYTDADRRVVALNGKRPVEKDWPRVPFRKETDLPIAQWRRQSYNIGWVLDETDVVVDVDMHDEKKNGLQSLERLCRDLSLQPLQELTPAVVETGSGGLHLYFCKPANLAIETQLANYPGVEFWTKGHQVVGVGSIHPDTQKSYKFGASGEFDFLTMLELPELPRVLLNKISRKDVQRSSGDLARVSVEVPKRELERIQAAISHIDPDVSYNEWVSILMSLHSLSNDEEVLAIADGWSALGGKYTPHDANSVESKWASFQRTALDDHVVSIGTLYGMAKAHGWNGQRDHLGPYVVSPDSFVECPSAEVASATPITSILAKSFPPLRYIIDGLLPDTGLYILSSNPKAGKTTLVHQACLSLLTETPFLGTKNDRCRKILFLALEDSERRLKLRSESILESSNLHLLNDTSGLAGLLVQTEWPQPPDGLELLDTWLGANRETDLVVIDTLAAFRRMPESNSHIYQQDYEMMRSIKGVADKHSVCILILHHNRKAQADDPGAAIGGTYGLIGAADGYMVLTKEGFADGQFVLAAQGREIAPVELALKRDGHAFSSLGDAQIQRLSPERREILDLLQFEGAPLTAQEVANVLKRPGPATRLLLTKMHKQGQLHKPKTGHYCLPSQGETAA